MNSRTYDLDSHNATTGTSGDFTYKIDIPNIGKEAGADGLAVVCLSATIPRTFYNVNATTGNTIQLKENNGAPVTITVPPGDYGFSTFATTMTALLNAASPNGWVYTMTKSYITSKYTYSSNNALQSSLIFPAQNGIGIADQFGFPASSTQTFSSVSITSSQVVNFSPIQTLLIISDIQTDAKGVLCDINTSGVGTAQSIHYRCPQQEAYMKPLNTKGSGIFRFMIKDSEGNTVNLNGSHVTLKLKIWEPK